ncbi:MAG: large conductance mechanosensitive channel protein MscL [Pirellulaceae bacterium]|nr:large conductance mechanosensitive channel protein MscL [Pirellulaceae bacterium]
MIKEFKEFALKGNMVDMAIGIMLGGAFGATVKSLVDNVMMPPIGYLMGQVDFSKMSAELPVEGADAEPVLIQYGLFINAVIALLILAFVLFLLIKLMNRMRTQEKPAPTIKKCNDCKMDIPIDATRCGHCTSQVAA